MGGDRQQATGGSGGKRQTADEIVEGGRLFVEVPWKRGAIEINV